MGPVDAVDQRHGVEEVPVAPVDRIEEAVAVGDHRGLGRLAVDRGVERIGVAMPS